MSDYHVLEISQGGRTARVAVHIDVPAGNNSTTQPDIVSWQNAVADAERPRNTDGTFGAIQSEIPNISGPELIELQNGAKIERVVEVSFKAEDDDVARKTKLDAGYNSYKAKILGRLAQELRFWGTAIDVP